MADVCKSIETFDKIVFSFKRKNRKGYGRSFGCMVGKNLDQPYQSKFRPYPLKPTNSNSFYFIGYL
jgi:hypothetical protein